MIKMAVVLLFAMAVATRAGAAPGPGPGPGPKPGPGPIVGPGPSPGPAGSNWEVRRKVNGGCHVERAAAGPNRGKRIVGPYANKARAEQDLKKLRHTPRCR